MLIKLNQIIAFSLIAFFLSMILYPLYIKLLKKLKAGQQIREASVTGENAKIFKKLHKHKAGTPTMGGGMFLLIMGIMVGLGAFLQHKGIINNSLINRQETYIILFGFFSMGILGLIDDVLNIRGIGRIKGLSAKAKTVRMVIFSAFISRRFYTKLGVDYINLRPIAGNIHLGLFFPIITFVITIAITNAVNITDGLDGLVGGLMTMILFILAVVTFYNQTYIATTVIGILMAILLAFLRFNINPAKIFMGDSGAFALGGFLSSLLYMLNMRMGIFIPFTLIFLIFILEVGSSGLQMSWKKIFKKKLFGVAPLHHYFEHKGMKETTFVMKAWLIQGVLAAITIIGIFYQLHMIN